MTEPAKAQVRRATPADVDAVVAVHLEAFGDAFLARLGPRFLKLYYEVLLDAPGGVLLVGEDPELGVVAFAAGATDPGDVTSGLRSHPGRLLWSVLRGVVADPTLVTATVRNVLRMRGASSGHRASAAELTSIAVSPRVEGSGLGHLALQAFEQACAESGCDVVELTTDARDNSHAISFYRRHGYRPTGFVAGRGRPMLGLERSLSQPTRRQDAEEAVPDRWYRVDFVLNKAITASDYRHLFHRRSRWSLVEFALPGAGTADLPGTHLDIGEGLAPSDPVRLLRYVYAARRGSGPPQLLHFFAFKLVAVGPLVAASAGLPSVVTVTGLGRMFSSGSPVVAMVRRLLVLPLLRRSLPKARRVMFQSRTDMDLLVDLVPSIAERSLLIRSAARLVELEDDDAVPPRRHDVIWISRLMEAKGGGDVLELAPLLARRGLELGVFGPPAGGEAELAARFERSDRDGELVYRGEVGAAEVAGAYRGCEVVLFLSRYGEGVPRVIIEAGLAERAVVAYETPLTRELLGEGRGLLVPPGDVGALDAAVAELMGDPSRRAEMGRALGEFVAEQFDEDRYVRRLDLLMADAVAPGMVDPAELAWAVDPEGRR